MKRILATLAAICAVSASAWAQDSTSDSNEAYVLQQARDKYQSSSGTTPASAEQPSASAPAADSSAQAAPTQTTTIQIPPASKAAPGSTIVTIEITKGAAVGNQGGEERQRPYTPFVLAFTPGLSIPFGVYDTSFSAAAIGALTGSVYGAQGAGVFNIADGDVHGLQGAGVFNTVGDDFRGLQGAGVFNIVGGDMKGVQGSGVFNIAEGARGLQSAGVFNIAKRVNGIQSAGVFNIADEMHGVQAAGVFNVAGKATGAMIGLVNVADELDGVAIGLVNIIGNGIHDVSVDYQFSSRMAYATYRSGTPFLYASFSLGQPVDEIARTTNGLMTGAGLGHRFRILFLTADVELGMESRIDQASLNQAYSAVVSHYDDFASHDPERWIPALQDIGSIGPFNTFGTLRASFGFGKRKGFGPYLGIKADFAPSGSDAIPSAMRSAFGSAQPYTLSIFDASFDIWPKWFVGIKF